MVYIYDRANVIDTEYKNKIQNVCQSLDENNTCEIVVFTLSSLTGHGITKKDSDVEINSIDELARRIYRIPLEGPDGTEIVGIGKEDKDNGMLLLVIEDDGWVKLLQGEKTQLIISNSRCGQILDEYFMPDFDDYNTQLAIYKTVVAVADILLEEYVPPSDEEPEPGPDLTPYLYWFGVIIVIIGVVALILFFVKPRLEKLEEERKRTKRIKQTITESLPAMEERCTELEEQIGDLEYQIIDYPEWAREKADSDLSLCKDSVGKAKVLIVSAKNKFQNNPESASEDLSNAGMYLSGAEDRISTVQEMPKKIKKYKEESPNELVKAKKDVKQLQEFLVSKKKEGLRIDDETKHVEDIVNTKIPSFERRINAKNVNHEKLWLGITGLVGSIAAIKLAVDNRIKLRDRNTKTLKELPSSIETIETDLLPKAESKLARMKEETPRDVWIKVANKLDNLPNLLRTARANIESAKKLNSMEVQQFDNANTKIGSVNNAISRAREIINAVDEKQSEVEKAKHDADDLLLKARNRVRDAQRKVRQWNVGYEAKRKADAASNKLRDAERSIRGGRLTDWLAITVLLGSVISLADEAINRADNDISRAESERWERRRRESRDDDSWESRSRGTIGGGETRGGGAHRKRG